MMHVNYSARLASVKNLPEIYLVEGKAAPGQLAVFYDGDTVIGGGTIDRALVDNPLVGASAADDLGPTVMQPDGC